MGSAVANPGRIFGDFCASIYDRRQSVNDHIHYVQNHMDNASRRQIAKELALKCSAVGRCAGSLRHYGRDSLSVDDLAFNPFLDRFDALHFNLFHVEEVGLRVVDDEEGADKEEDVAAEILIQRVRALKKAFKCKRLDGAENTKFTISTETEQEQKGGILHSEC